MTGNAWVNKVCVGVFHDNFPDVRISLLVCTSYDLAKTHKMKLRSCLASSRRTVGYLKKNHELPE